MPRYWVCERCGTYNLKSKCDTCGLSKEEATQYETILERDPEEDLADQDDWMESIIEDIDYDDYEEE